MFKKPNAMNGSGMRRISVDLPGDILLKLEKIAQHQSGWSSSKKPVEVEDIVRLALNVYLKSNITSDGTIIPNVQADHKGEESPVVRMTNAILVNAIQKEIFEFQVPPAAASASDADLAAQYPEHMQSWFVRRLQVMTTTIAGTIPIVHSGNPYNVGVEFDTTLEGRPRVRVKITGS